MQSLKKQESEHIFCFRKHIIRNHMKNFIRQDQNIIMHHTEAMDRAMEGGIDDLGPRSIVWT